MPDIIDGPGTSEGSAMMGSVYDMAPALQVFFASSFSSPDNFPCNILLPRNTRLCDVIAGGVS